MKNRLIPCVLACLMIFLVGCNGNTAKEAAQEITKTETSFPAGNTETNSQEDTAEEPESTAVQEETPITAEESKSNALKGMRVEGMEINNLIGSMLQDYSFDYSSISALRDIKRVFNNRLMDYFAEKDVL